MSNFLPFDWHHDKFVLITGHRRENFGDGFQQICLAILELAKKFPQVKFVYPVHLNPNVKDIVYKMLSNRKNIHLINPLSYPAFIWLMSKSHIILTDSGGIQEEAPSFGKPVLILRKNTERHEAVDSGTAKIIGTDPNIILNEVTKLLIDKREYQKMSTANNPFGDGNASERIVEKSLSLISNYN